MRGLLLLAVVMALMAGEARAQEPEQPQAVLSVVVIYDGNHDGVQEGVGLGVPVLVRESGTAQETLNYTDNDSRARFVVNLRTYIANAYPRQTRLFYVWMCFGSVHVDEPGEVLTLRCVERFFMRLPWASVGSVVEQ